MGMTIHYRGSLADLDRVEEFEDRVLDMALEIGAAAQVWRSTADHDPTRVVRGLLLDVSPGQETTSLLLSPEGWLIPPFDIEAAELGTLAEPPFCFVKTQFGSVEGHVALVELLTFLKQEWFCDLTVSDEAGYWENRDLRALARKLAQNQALIDAMSDGLRQSRLSAEAAEDPEILATRIERIARQVHETWRRPPEHAPLDLDDDATDEAWRESLPPQIASDDPLDRVDAERHPLQRAASDLWLRLDKLFDGVGEPASNDIRTLMHGVGEMAGGLAQALSHSATASGSLERGLALVQLKRAWRGAAFAKGALVPLCAAGLLKVSELEQVRAALAELASGIVEEFCRIREQRSSG